MLIIYVPTCERSAIESFEYEMKQKRIIKRKILDYIIRVEKLFIQKLDHERKMRRQKVQGFKIRFSLGEFGGKY